ncbi:hypothetical protein [Streptomyces sp. x-19]|uniref:hypothetical protein n=1 Tax=Streptomyces sp. x-19 TaxID=2789280 RepID=UPI00397F662D
MNTMHGGGGFSGGGHHGGGFGGHHHSGGLSHHSSHHHHTGDSQGFVAIPSFLRRGSSGDATGVAPLPVALGLLLAGLIVGALLAAH